eukprot:scaffold52568_cov60-Phaeocystis_antarctica.AAC.1
MARRISSSVADLAKGLGLGLGLGLRVRSARWLTARSLTRCADGSRRGLRRSSGGRATRRGCARRGAACGRARCLPRVAARARPGADPHQATSCATRPRCT